MKLVAIDNLLDGRKNHRLIALIEEFVNSDAKICKVELEPNEYKNQTAAFNSISRAARHSKRGVKAHSIKGVIYLVKEDLIETVKFV